MVVLVIFEGFRLSTYQILVVQVLTPSGLHIKHLEEPNRHGVPAAAAKSQDNDLLAVSVTSGAAMGGVGV